MRFKRAMDRLIAMMEQTRLIVINVSKTLSASRVSAVCSARVSRVSVQPFRRRSVASMGTPTRTNVRRHASMLRSQQRANVLWTSSVQIQMFGVRSSNVSGFHLHCPMDVSSLFVKVAPVPTVRPLALTMDDVCLRVMT